MSLVSTILHPVNGTELSSVVFIRDYVQLNFDGETATFTVTAFTPPTVTKDDIKYGLKTSGFRDALCSLINKTVIRTKVIEKVAIKLYFEDSDLVEISLREEDYDGPEAAMFSDGETLAVW